MEGLNCRGSDVRVLSVVGLFQFWMFIAGARKPENLLADGDYRGAADAQAEIAALTRAGDGSWPFTVPAATSAIGAGGAVAMPGEEADEAEEKRQAKSQASWARAEVKVAG